MNIDDMLSTPLHTVPDHDFSAGVMTRVLERHRRRALIKNRAIMGASAGLCLLMPFTELGHRISTFTVTLSGSYMMPLAAVALGILFVCVVLDYARD